MTKVWQPIILEGTIKGDIKSGKRSTYAKYPFEFMDVNDILEVPVEKLSQSRGAAYQWGKRNDAVFTTAVSVGDDGKPLGCIIKRIA